MVDLLRSIALEAVTNGEYNVRNSYWYNVISRNPGPDKVGIINPFIFEDYNNLLQAFMECSDADVIDYYDPELLRWKSEYMRNLGTSDIDRLADIARKDRYNIGALELRFDPAGLDRPGRTDGQNYLATVRIAEIEGGVVGFNVNFPEILIPHFIWIGDHKITQPKLNGLCSPLPLRKK